MSKSELFKQAIAEAKELKDISMAQAKQQIAEAFAPRISEMFKAKVQAMDENEEMEENVDKMEENSMEEVNETSLDEILAELEEDSLNEADDELKEEELEEAADLEEGLDLEEAKDDKKDDKKDEKKDAPKKDAPKKDKAPADDAEGMDDLGADDMGMDDMDADLGAGMDVDAEGQEVAELSVEEFKNLVRDVVADVLAGHGEAGMDDLDGDAAGLDMGAGDDMGMDSAAGADDSISLDEILAELEEGELEENDHMEEGEKMEENEELEEAVKTIEELKATINEMNLFNAKLLYTNKIFEAKSLSNTQKAKVLNAFDRAANLNEVKAVYKTLVTTLDSTKRTQLKESLGFASKAVGGAPAKPILEENAYVTRFQQLAGIKKSN